MTPFAIVVNKRATVVVILVVVAVVVVVFLACLRFGVKPSGGHVVNRWSRANRPA